LSIFIRAEARGIRICYYWVEDAMSITLHIPDSVARSLRIPEGEAEQRLRQELAVALYARGLLSLGKASELAGTSRFQFSELLTQQNIARHYGEEELAEDLKYASGE
jgi:predicted HTH domain antitoxin